MIKKNKNFILKDVNKKNNSKDKNKYRQDSNGQ